MSAVKWIIGIGLASGVVATCIYFYKKNKTELKGKGEVTAESKKENKIVFVKK